MKTIKLSFFNFPIEKQRSQSLTSLHTSKNLIEKPRVYERLGGGKINRMENESDENRINVKREPDSDI